MLFSTTNYVSKSSNYRFRHGQAKLEISVAQNCDIAVTLFNRIWGELRFKMKLDPLVRPWLSLAAERGKQEREFWIRDVWNFERWGWNPPNPLHELTGLTFCSRRLLYTGRKTSARHQAMYFEVSDQFTQSNSPFSVHPWFWSRNARVYQQKRVLVAKSVWFRLSLTSPRCGSTFGDHLKTSDRIEHSNVLRWWDSVWKFNLINQSCSKLVLRDQLIGKNDI